MKAKRYLACIVLIVIFIFMFSLSFALADENPEPNFEQNGVQYYLSAPNSLTIEMDILGTHQITLRDGEEATIEWDYNVPSSTIGYVSETITYMSMEFSRDVYMIVTNELVINYSRAAYESGQQFITGELTQHIIAYETLAATFPIPTEYSFDQVEVVVSQLSSGNFESIEQGSLALSFPVSSRQIVNSLSNAPVPSYLAEEYRYIEIVSEHAQNINLGSEFTAQIIEQLESVPTQLPAELPTQVPEELPEELPLVTPIVTIEPAMDTAIGETAQQTAEAVREAIPNPSTAEIVVSAVSAAAAVGAAGAIAAAAGGAASSASSAGTASAAGAMNASAGLQQATQGAATAAAGNIVISFLKDIITGLRDMFMDESRAHASGKMSENLKKLGKK